jgi:drug/metabolite transporter (DMT)-like permease
MVGLTIRYAFALLILFVVMKLTSRKIALDSASIKRYFVLGFFSMGLSYLCTYWAMSYIPSSLSSILWATFPLFNGLFAHFLLATEKLNLRRLLAIIIALVGVIMILSDQRLVFTTEMLIGCLVVLLGVSLGAYPNVYIKKRGIEYDPMVLTAMALVVGMVIHLTGALITGQFSEMDWSFRNLGAAMYLGTFGSAVAFFVYFSLLKHIEVVKLSFVTFLTPVIATFVGLIFLHETITPKEMAGIGLIFSGLFLYDFRKYYHYIRNLKTCPD